MTVLGVVVRTVQLAAALGLVGAFAMLLIAGRSGRATARAWEARVIRLVRALVVALIAAGVGALAVQAAVATGRAGALAEPRAWLHLMGHSQFGTVWIVRHALLLLLAGLALLRAREVSAADWLAWRVEGWALAVVGVAAMAWAGHAAASEGWGIWAPLADALHLAAGGAWLGALLPLSWLLAAASREDGADARPYAVLAARRFSRLALIAMLALIATGLVNAWVQVGGVPALIGTRYGWLLVLKIALLVPILVLAAHARTHLLPALSGEAVAVGRPAMARLGRFVGVELAIAAAILVVTSWLGVTAPARHDEPSWPLSYRLSYEAMADVPGVKTRFLIGSQVAVLGLLGALAALIVRRQAPALLATGAAAIVAGLYVALPPLSVDAYPTTYVRSSVPYQASSIAAGIGLYGQHCAVCHGRGAEGDGPGGAGLPRRPADLTAPHTGQHTAGDLYWWLTHGIPAAGMPPFASALTPDDRWDLINYLRALSSGREARVLSPLIEPNRPAIAAPDFTYAIGPSPARTLKELRGAKNVLLVLFTLPASRARLDTLARVYGELQVSGAEVIAAPMNADPNVLAALGGDPPILYPVVTDGATDIVRAYTLFSRTLAPAGLRPDAPPPPHVEFLIDRTGYLRARWIPGEGRASWSELVVLRDEMQVLATEAAAPPPDEHVH